MSLKRGSKSGRGYVRKVYNSNFSLKNLSKNKEICPKKLELIQKMREKSSETPLFI